MADPRGSPGVDIIRLLASKGAEVYYHYPFVRYLEHEGHALSSVTLDLGVLAATDLIVIVTDHSSVDYEMIRSSGRPVVDTRNVLRHDPVEEAPSAVQAAEAN